MPEVQLFAPAEVLKQKTDKDFDELLEFFAKILKDDEHPLKSSDFTLVKVVAEVVPATVHMVVTADWSETRTTRANILSAGLEHGLTELLVGIVNSSRISLRLTLSQNTWD